MQSNQLYKKSNTHDGELYVSGTVSGTPFVDVLDPLLVVVESVCRNADELHTALLKVGRSAGSMTLMPWHPVDNKTHSDAPACDFGKLGRADRGEVPGVREEDGLRVSRVETPAPRSALRLIAPTQEFPIHSWNLMLPLVV